MPRIFALFLSVLAFACSSNSCLPADRIVFDRLGPSEATLFISNTDGSAERPLTQPRELDYDPSWSQRGDWIVFTSERGGSADLYRIHLMGQESNASLTIRRTTIRLRFLPMGTNCLCLDRDGGRANLWVLDAATHKARPLTPGMGAISVHRGPQTVMDRLSLRIARATFHRGGAMGTPASGRYLLYPSRWHGAQTHLAARRVLRQPQMDPDSKAIVTYCMSSQDTLTYRFGSEDGDSQLLKIDIGSGATSPIAAGPGVKFFRRYCVRERSLTYAATKRSPESFMEAENLARRERISALLVVARRRASRLQPVRLQAPARTTEGMEPKSEL